MLKGKTKRDLTIYVSEMQKKTKPVKVKPGSTVADCLKAAKVKIGKDADLADMDLRINVKTKAKLTTKVKDGQEIQLIKKIQGGR